MPAAEYHPAGFCRCGYRTDPGVCAECGRVNRRVGRRDPRSASSWVLRAGRWLAIVGVTCTTLSVGAVALAYRALPYEVIVWLGEQPEPLRDWGYAIGRHQAAAFQERVIQRCRQIEQSNYSATSKPWWADIWGKLLWVAPDGRAAAIWCRGGCGNSVEHLTGQVLDFDNASLTIEFRGWGGWSERRSLHRIQVGTESAAIWDSELNSSGCRVCWTAEYAAGSSIGAKVYEGEIVVDASEIVGPCIGQAVQSDEPMGWLERDPGFVQTDEYSEELFLIGGWIDGGHDVGLCPRQILYAGSSEFGWMPGAEVIWVEASRAYILATQRFDEEEHAIESETWYTLCSDHRVGGIVWRSRP